MKKEDMQKLILFVNFLALALIVIGIFTKTYLIAMLVIGVIMLIISVFLSQKWKKLAKEEQQTV